MSPCEAACIDMDCDHDNEFYVESVIVARKWHRCCECDRVIQPKESYERVNGKTDGSIWTTKSCVECREIRKALVCGSWEFGSLWYEIEQAVFVAWLVTSPVDCLAKIESLSARDKLRDRFRDWRETVKR